MRMIQDSHGRVIGRVLTTSAGLEYMDPSGRVVARVIDNRTYDASGRFMGYGDQGMLVLQQQMIFS